MAIMTQYDPSQDDNGAEMDILLTNNDPSTTYDSAELSLEAITGNVADGIIANNPSYASSTRAQVMSEWGASISGEVSSGWTAAKDANGFLQLTHSGQNYTPWISSEQHSGAYDLMALTLNVPKSQLDFNQNGVFDPATESIYKTTETVPSAFVGTTTTGFDIATQGQSYGVIPEPAALGLILVGSGLMLGAKRLLTKK